MQIPPDEFVALLSMPAAPETPEDPKLGLAAEILRCRGTIHLKAWGASMLPSVWPGDLLTIQSAAHEEVVPGDIVLVLRGKRFFVHRTVEIQRGRDCFSWITRGDAMPHNDPPAAASELLGRVAVSYTHLILRLAVDGGSRPECQWCCRARLEARSRVPCPKQW